MKRLVTQWFERTFKQKVLEIKVYPKGLTNKNWWIKTSDDEVLVRWPKQDAKHIVFRDHEAKALKLIQQTDLDVETLYFDPETGIKVSRFIPDLKTFTEYHGQDKIKRTALLMRKLHALQKTIDSKFDPIHRYEQYANHVKHPLVTQSQAQAIVSKIKNLNRPLTLCHNDWVAGNICFSSSQDYLIDYEYAGDNDPYFDVMSFITENDLSDEEKAEFMVTYFDGPWHQEETLLYAYGDFHNLLWCTWACMMYESRHDQIYLDIAQLKLHALEKGLKESR